MKVINFFGGPGCGKSTTAAQVFAHLKGLRVPVELCQEVAKDLLWEKRYGAMRCQPYVFGEQLWRLQRLEETGVEVAVCDSPIFLSAVYGRHLGPSWAAMVHQFHKGFDSLDVVLDRVHAYDPIGRRRNPESALQMDTDIREALSDADVPFTVAPGDSDGSSYILEEARKRWPEVFPN